MDTLLEVQGSSILLWVLIGIMVIGLVYTTISGNKKQKQYYEEMLKLQEKFVVGAKVKTKSGVFGEIIDIRTALDGTKVVTIKSGDADNAMTFEIDINGIAHIDDKDVKYEEEKDENIDELMKKVQETSENLNEQATSKVIEEDGKNVDDKNKKEIASEEEKSVDDGDVFTKTKKSKTTKKTTKKKE